MIKSPFHFFQVDVETFPRDATVMVEPVFRIRPEAFNTIEMISAFRFPLVLCDHHMVSADIGERRRVPIIGVRKGCLPSCGLSLEGLSLDFLCSLSEMSRPFRSSDRYQIPYAYWQHPSHAYQARSSISISPERAESAFICC